MGKIVQTVAMVVGGIALIATGVGAFVGTAAVTAALGGISAAALTTAAAVLSVGASLLNKPKQTQMSPATGDRLNVSINIRAARIAAMGSTALATDLRDQEFSGTDKEYLHRFIVNAAHKVSEIREIWFDDQLAWTLSGGVQGQYVGYLTVQAILEGAPGNAVNLGARMGTSRRFTGCAYTYFRFKLTGNTKKTESPFAQQVPTRVTIVGDGMACYDPRQDDTQPGGAGNHRAGDQATWTWGDHARNPACQLGTWLLGWRIQNPQSLTWKLSVGRGIPADRVNWQSIIDGANLCDEDVELAVGGTEPRYRSDGLISEDDDPTQVIEGFKACMNADLDDQDGLLRLTVFHNDLATPDADLATDDVQGDYIWIQTQPLDASFNVVRGTYVEPDTRSLYQPAPYAEVSFASPDGIERVHKADFGLVQSKSQAERLAKQRAQRQQYGGTFQATFLATAWKVQKNSVLRLTFAPEGWVNKLFRVVETEVRQDGLVPMLLREEHADIYAWDSEEGPPVQIATPTEYAAGEAPFPQFLGGVAEGATMGATAGTDLYRSDGTTVLTQAEVRTLEGTAAAISGQGSFATISSITSGNSGTLIGAAALTYALLAATAVRLGINITRADGTTALTDALAVTALGTAAAIAGQGSFATISSITSGNSGTLIGTSAITYTLLASTAVRLGTNITKADGSTALTDALAVTALGTAAAIAGQGSFATISSITSGNSGTLIGSNAITYALLAATAVRLGTNITRADGSTALTDALAVTALGTAAAIAGQGSFATVSSITSGNSGTLIGTAALTYTLLASTAVRLGTNVVRADGATSLTDALAVTALGTAAAISGQGSFATVSSITSGNSGTLIGAAALTYALLASTAVRLGTNVVRADGSTSLTDALAVTALGTAAAIAGQGSFATVSSITSGNSGTLIGSNAITYALLATTAVRLGTNITRADGSTSLTDALAVTALGIASGFSGQGSLATLSSVTATYLNVTIGGGNLLKNSSFEGATWADTYGTSPAGFAPYSNGGNGEATTMVAGRVGGNAWRLSWTSSGGTKGFYFANVAGVDNQNIFKPYSTFIVSFYAKGTGAAVGATAFIAWNLAPASAVAVLNPPLSADWQRYVFKVAWGATIDPNGFLAFGGANGVSSATFDDVQIEEGDYATAYAPGLLPGEVRQDLLSVTAVRLGTNVVRADGSTSVTDALAITSLGIASAISGQGALATLNLVNSARLDIGAISGDNIVPNATFYDGSATWWFGNGVTYLSAVASGLSPPAGGVARAPNGIVSGEARANNSAAIPFSFPRAHVSAWFYSTAGSLSVGYLGVYCYKIDGSYNGFAFLLPAVAGYGAWSRVAGWVDIPALTASILPTWLVTNASGGTFYMTGMRVSVAEYSADVTQNAQLVHTAPTNVPLAADYTGAFAAGVLPKNNISTVTKGGVPVTTAAETTYAIQNAVGGCAGNVTVDNTAGSATKGVQTIGTGLTAAGSYEVVAYYNAVQIGSPVKVNVPKTIASAPTSSTKGGDFDPSGFSCTSTSYVEVARVPGLVKATGETIRAYFSTSYLLTASSNANRTLAIKWQYSVAGANSWTDLGSGVSGSSAGFLLGSGDQTQGSVTCNQTVAPANGTYDVRAVAAISSAANSANITCDMGSGSVLVGA